MRIFLIIIACCLFLGLTNLPIGYYTFLRVITSIGAVIVIFFEHNKINKFWTFLFVLIAIIFNPIIPIYLNNKSNWMPIDIISGIIFLIKSFNLKLNESKKF